MVKQGRSVSGYNADTKKVQLMVRTKKPYGMGGLFLERVLHELLIFVGS